MHHCQIWLLVHTFIACKKAGVPVPTLCRCIWVMWKKLSLTSKLLLGLEKTTIGCPVYVIYCFIFCTSLTQLDAEIIPEESAVIIIRSIDIGAVQPTCDLTDLLCWSNAAVQSYSTVGAHKVLAPFRALGKGVIVRDVNYEATFSLFL